MGGVVTRLIGRGNIAVVRWQNCCRNGTPRSLAIGWDAVRREPANDPDQVAVAAIWDERNRAQISFDNNLLEHRRQFLRSDRRPTHVDRRDHIPETEGDQGAVLAGHLRTDMRHRRVNPIRFTDHHPQRIDQMNCPFEHDQARHLPHERLPHEQRCLTSVRRSKCAVTMRRDSDIAERSNALSAKKTANGAGPTPPAPVLVDVEQDPGFSARVDHCGSIVHARSERLLAKDIHSMRRRDLDMFSMEFGSCDDVDEIKVPLARQHRFEIAVDMAGVDIKATGEIVGPGYCAVADGDDLDVWCVGPGGQVIWRDAPRADEGSMKDTATLQPRPPLAATATRTRPSREPPHSAEPLPAGPPVNRDRWSKSSVVH